MTFANIKLVGLAGLIATVPVLAVAQLELGSALGTTEEDIRAALAVEDIEILEIELEDGEIEVEYLLDGVEYEAEIDPATGTVIALEIEDDSDEDDDDQDDDEDDDEDAEGAEKG